MADTSTSRQLLFGFHALEESRWRWTAQTFSIALKPPAGAERRGARLALRLFIAPSQIKKLERMTLCAEVEGRWLGSETFAEPGEYWYSREVPAEALATSILPVTFHWERALDASLADGRELGAVVTTALLETK
jgi:hypothetical protein